MAYFNLSTNATAALSFGGNSLTCLQSVEVTGSAPNTEIECSGSTSVTNIPGVPRYSLTATGALDDEDDPLLGNIDVGTTGAIAFDPAGTTVTHMDISSTNGTVTDFSASFPVNGFSSYSVTIALDDLTIGSN